MYGYCLCHRVAKKIVIIDAGSDPLGGSTKEYTLWDDVKVHHPALLLWEWDCHQAFGCESTRIR